MRHQRSLLKSAVGLAVLSASVGMLPTTANAALNLITVSSGGNDCSGVFGPSFSECVVKAGFPIESPSIIKYNPNGSVSEINDQFKVSNGGTIQGDEFTFSFSKATNEGDWSYTKGTGDPEVRFVSAKGGNGFNLTFYVPEAETGSGGDCEAAFAGGTTLDQLTEACQGHAQPVLAGEFSLPTNNGGETPDLSHIVFYDTGGGGGCTDPNGCPPPSGGAPTPSSMTLFGAAALFGGVALRRRRHGADRRDNRDEEAIDA